MPLFCIVQSVKDRVALLSSLVGRNMARIMLVHSGLSIIIEKNVILSNAKDLFQL